MNNDLLKRIDEELQWLPYGSSKWQLLNDCRAEIERPSKPYVPMTDDEITEATQVMKHDLLHEPTLYCWRQVEAAVIKRLGLEIKHD